jgi:hypothetical protein
MRRVLSLALLLLPAAAAAAPPAVTAVAYAPKGDAVAFAAGGAVQLFNPRPANGSRRSPRSPGG